MSAPYELEIRRACDGEGLDQAKAFEICDKVAAEGNEGAQQLAQAVIARFHKYPDVSEKARLLELVDILVVNCGDTFHLQLVEEGFFQTLISDKRVQGDQQFRTDVQRHITTWLGSLSGNASEIANDAIQRLSGPGSQTDRQHGSSNPRGPSGQLLNRGPRGVITFQTPKLEKQLCKFLLSSYVQAGDIVRTSRRVKWFSLQAIHIARQAFHLIIRFNDSVGPDGPTEEQHDEGMELDDALEELEDKIDELEDLELDEAIRSENDHKYDLARLYQMFFATRDFYPNHRDYTTDPVLKRLVDSDHATLILAHRLQSRSPHAEGFQILDIQIDDRDDGGNQGHVSDVSASQAEPDDTETAPATRAPPPSAEEQQVSTAAPTSGGNVENVVLVEPQFQVAAEGAQTTATEGQQQEGTTETATEEEEDHEETAEDTKAAMDPFNILGLLGGVLSRAKAIFDAIDQVQQADAAGHEALKELQRTVGDVEDDIKFFKTMISVWESPENGEIFSLFIAGHDAKCAMKEFNEHLSTMTILLDIEPAAEPSTTPTVHRPLKLFLRSLLPRAGQRTAVSEPQEARIRILDTQQKAKRAFRLLWNLYIISQQQATAPAFSLDENNVKSVADTLDAVSREFPNYPFGISRQCGSFSLSVLNSDHDAASRREKLARKLGKGWIDGLINRYHVPTSQLIGVQITLFELIWSGTIRQLRENPTCSAGDPEHEEFRQILDQLDWSLQEAIVRSRRPRFTISFYGMVKAGKSLLLNALIGKVVLPLNELPSTAWPCRLVHVKGQAQPELCVKTSSFNRAIKALRARGYAAKMKDFQPPTYSIFDAMFDDPTAQPESSPEAKELENIHHEWIDLHTSTRDNLLTFEEPGFELSADRVFGVKAVNDLLGKINDIVRLCKRFGLKFEGTEEDWPVLSVEFKSLKDRKDTEIYEFIDLPGIGEDSDENKSLVRLAASQSNAIVPIVSFIELPRSGWRALPKLAASSYNRKPDLVVCTHLDRVSEENLQQQLWMVSRAFWPGPQGASHRVLPCSPLMGLSANQLLEQAEATKPSFEEVWEPTSSIRVYCASRILGEGKPAFVYNDYDRDGWVEKLEEQYKNSGLPDVINKLTREMVDNARENALTSETVAAIRLVRELRKKEERKLLEARRTRGEFEAAKNAYDKTRQKLEVTLETWDLDEQEQIDESHKQLQNAYALVFRKAVGFVQPALQKTLKQWGLIDRESTSDSTDTLQRAPSDAEYTNQKVLKVTSEAHAKEFLRLSQGELHAQLQTLKAEYVEAVRRSGQEAKSFRIMKLQEVIQHDTASQPEFRDDLIAELESHSFDIRELAYQEIKKVIKRYSTRYTAKSAFRTIEAQFARRWLSPPTSGDDVVRSGSKDQVDPGHSQQVTDEDKKVEAAARRTLDSLGFMLRAPITAMTTITWTLGAPVWAFMSKSRSYHLSMDVITQQYQDQIVQPWLEGLNKEGEKSLLGIIKLSSDAARDSLKNTLDREGKRYQKELEDKRRQKPVDQEVVENLVAAYVNLLAVEEALHALSGRISPQ